ncbi:MAG: LemA family protein [Bariatricus sp.]
MKNKKMILIIVAGVLAVLLMAFTIIMSIRNKAISLEEAIETAESDIEVQEKKRVDLVYNLADCVKEYDEHEAKILEEIAESRKQDAEMENVSTSIKAVAEAYPELKSNEQYKNLMNELIILENEIAQYRTAYNKLVEKYKRYVRKYPQELFLEWMGYEIQEYKRLEYDAPEDAPQDLFGEE